MLQRAWAIPHRKNILSSMNDMEFVGKLLKLDYFKMDYFIVLMLNTDMPIESN